MIFRSKVDAFFVNFILIVLAIVALSCFWPLVFMKGVTWLAAFLMTASFSLIVSILVWSIFSIKYAFCEKHLFVKGGPFRSRISYGDITKVDPTKDIFTGYRILSSRDALEICYKTGIAGSVKISPEHKKEFISELQKRCPHVRFRE
ncbi:PH domain-containing protein [Terribacillus aidingensis]|uniref:PH domain-containing protein n=1 Tax=Terribacillus aidingensis TaxID=586416 RepID=A0A285NKU6_9BACI|nr:PH domain-containing protein [Terribacillus aidingensis]SNZ10112.1 PH domain-containing protein [Terribacillus aidingensis]